MPSKLLKCTWSIHWWLKGKLSSVVPTRDVYGCNQAEMSSWGAAERDTLERIEGFMICSCKPAVEENKLRSRKFRSLMVCECVCACLRVCVCVCACACVCDRERERGGCLCEWPLFMNRSSSIPRFAAGNYFFESGWSKNKTKYFSRN